jgi:hypothetical protein
MCEAEALRAGQPGAAIEPQTDALQHVQHHQLDWPRCPRVRGPVRRRSCRRPRPARRATLSAPTAALCRAGRRFVRTGCGIGSCDLGASACR